MTTIECGHALCGVAFSVTDDVYRRATKCERSIVCPNGHTSSWGKSDAEKRIEAMTSMKEATQRFLDAERATSAMLRRRIAYWKGIAARLRKGTRP